MKVVGRYYDENVNENEREIYQYVSFFELIDKLMELDPTWVEDFLNSETQTFFDGVKLDLQVKREVLGMESNNNEFETPNKTQQNNEIIRNYVNFQEGLVRKFVESAKYQSANINDSTILAMFNKVNNQKTM